MFSKALLYTAVTRAQKLCVLIGEQRALSIALSRGEHRRRNSTLTERVLDPVARATAASEAANSSGGSAHGYMR
jgi:ATP-dependent exoDNAse (exonuclease V) alpha subunit